MYARLKLLWLSHLIEQRSLLSSQVVMICSTSAVQALQLTMKMFPCQSSGSNATRCADSSMNVSGFTIALQQAEAFSTRSWSSFLQECSFLCRRRQGVYL